MFYRFQQTARGRLWWKRTTWVGWEILAAAENDKLGNDAHDGDQDEGADDALDAIGDAVEHDAHDGDQDEGADDAAREAETERGQVFRHQGFNGRYVA